MKFQLSITSDIVDSGAKMYMKNLWLLSHRENYIILTNALENTIRHCPALPTKEELKLGFLMTMVVRKC